MNKLVLHILFMFVGHATVSGQTNFQTICPGGPVVMGESFQVQYVLDDTEDSEFFAPDFKGFRVISGPNIYTGSAFGSSGPRKLKNIVYTIAAVQSGVVIVPGASARVNNKLYSSNKVLLRVYTRAEAARKLKSQQETAPQNDDIFLGPGEDAYAKIRRNLFMKVMVDKTSCFVGEPVTAVFKLYSRLDSRSDIVKNPGFYGFTVQDMINLDDRQSSIERINGKDFDVHIVRKVQLYPLRPGRFEIDAMEVRNKVRFSKSAVTRQPEQEIIEGVVPFGDEDSDPNTAVFENSMSTHAVPITVKAVPEKSKPATYDGATGNFKLAATLMKNDLSKNEEGELVISISGNGNFTQLSPPGLQWPHGVDAFEPIIKDSIDYMQVPMHGKREFHYKFVSSKPGSYMLPAVDFSYFNPDTNAYKELHTTPLNISVSGLENPVEKVKEQIRDVYRNGKWNRAWLLAAAMLMVGAVIFYLVRKKQATRAIVQPKPVSSLQPVAAIMQPAVAFAAADEKMFCAILRDCTWKFLAERFSLSGSQVSKDSLSASMQKKGIDTKSRSAVLQLLADCETGIFTEATGIGQNDQMLAQARALLDTIDRQLLV